MAKETSYTITKMIIVKSSGYVYIVYSSVH